MGLAPENCPIIFELLQFSGNSSIQSREELMSIQGRTVHVTADE